MSASLTRNSTQNDRRMPTFIRVLIADDHALVRKGLIQLFNLSDDIRAAGEAINGPDVIAQARQTACELILLDLNMPGSSGLELIVQLRGMADIAPILVLSTHDEPQIVRRAFTAGAAGYLTKDSDPELLLRAIRKVAAGLRFLDPTLAQAMAFDIAAQAGKPRHESLSPREQEVLMLLAGGHSVNAVAERLGLSNKTVSTHKARLMEKMDFATNVDLVKYALNNQLVD